MGERVFLADEPQDGWLLPWREARGCLELLCRQRDGLSVGWSVGGVLRVCFCCCYYGNYDNKGNISWEGNSWTFVEHMENLLLSTLQK